MLKKKTGATVNVLVNKSKVNGHILRNLRGLRELARESGQPLNVIPVETPLPSYMRDPGMFARSQEKTTFLANPYVMQGVLGDVLTEELARACSFHFNKTFQGLAKFDAAYEMISNPAYQGGNSTNIPKEVRRVRTASDRPSGEAAQFGGNFMVVPGGSLVVGENSSQSPDPDLLRYFEKSHKVLKIRIPELLVGHIDEVYRVIPSSDACGYAVLYASPTEMIEFLKTRPEQEEVVTKMDFTHPTERNPEVFRKFSSLRQEVEDLQRNGNAISAEVLKNYRNASIAYANVISENHTVSNLLKDERLIQRWKEVDSLVHSGLKKILNEIQSTTRSNCEPKRIPLPVYWGELGNPLIPNPVNALSINGKYFFSDPIRPLFSQAKEVRGGSLEFARVQKYESYRAYSNYVQRRLKFAFAGESIPVDTEEFNEGNGNFHCATSNIFLPCK